MAFKSSKSRRYFFALTKYKGRVIASHPAKTLSEAERKIEYFKLRHKGTRTYSIVEKIEKVRV
jgi:hypothetical protein